MPTIKLAAHSGYGMMNLIHFIYVNGHQHLDIIGIFALVMSSNHHFIPDPSHVYLTNQNLYG
ncbi:hypothetical protein [Peribacillus asahii]|uniref:hypothetical protein n=1 Tax=Peribacillus asahii TaxID=228899 RepID=UPI00207AC278|nr:hypothetical protein [Peribacillus asahii]USK61365.1 hypothetical protein LIT37_08620 [Peribacillus asahii]